MSLARIGFLAIVASLSIGPVAAQERTADPIAHANGLLDTLATNGVQAFTEQLGTAIGNKEVTAYQAQFAPFEKRKAKFRGVALDRNYGSVIRDIIIYQYMIVDHLPFMYFRFTYKMTEEGWRLTNFRLDAEASQPFPAIYGVH